LLPPILLYFPPSLSQVQPAAPDKNVYDMVIGITAAACLSADIFDIFIHFLTPAQPKKRLETKVARLETDIRKMEYRKNNR